MNHHPELVGCAACRRRAVRARKVRDFLIYLAVAVPLSIAAFYALAWGLSVAPTMQ